MTITIQGTQVIAGPSPTYFHFYADEHVKHHSRWDPDIQLENRSGEPLHVGSVLRRQNTRSGTPIQGSMEVGGIRARRSIGMLIHDGPAQMRGLAMFEPVTEGRTRITVTIDLPGKEPKVDTTRMAGGLQRTLDTLKQLVESEL